MRKRTTYLLLTITLLIAALGASSANANCKQLGKKSDEYGTTWGETKLVETVKGVKVYKRHYKGWEEGDVDGVELEYDVDRYYLCPKGGSGKLIALPHYIEEGAIEIVYYIPDWPDDHDSIKASLKKIPINGHKKQVFNVRNNTLIAGSSEGIAMVDLKTGKRIPVTSQSAEYADNILVTNDGDAVLGLVLGPTNRLFLTFWTRKNGFKAQLVGYGLPVLPSLDLRLVKRSGSYIVSWNDPRLGKQTVATNKFFSSKLYTSSNCGKAIKNISTGDSDNSINILNPTTMSYGNTSYYFYSPFNYRSLIICTADGTVKNLHSVDPTCGTAVRIVGFFEQVHTVLYSCYAESEEKLYLKSWQYLNNDPQTAFKALATLSTGEEQDTSDGGPLSDGNLISDVWPSSDGRYIAWAQTIYKHSYLKLFFMDTETGTIKELKQIKNLSIITEVTADQVTYLTYKGNKKTVSVTN